MHLVWWCQGFKKCSFVTAAITLFWRTKCEDCLLKSFLKCIKRKRELFGIVFNVLLSESSEEEDILSPVASGTASARRTSRIDKATFLILLTSSHFLLTLHMASVYCRCIYVCVHKCKFLCSCMLIILAFLPIYIWCCEWYFTQEWKCEVGVGGYQMIQASQCLNVDVFTWLLLQLKIN